MGINSTGTKLYLVALSAKTDTKAECLTAIGTGFEIGEITGSIETGGTKVVEELKYLDGKSEKTKGSVSYSSFTIDMPYKTTNTGQGKLIDSWANDTDYKAVIAYTNGDYKWFDCFASGAKETIANDKFVMMSFTVEQNGVDTRVTA